VTFDLTLCIFKSKHQHSKIFPIFQPFKITQHRVNQKKRKMEDDSSVNGHAGGNLENGDSAMNNTITSTTTTTTSTNTSNKKQAIDEESKKEEQMEPQKPKPEDGSSTQPINSQQPAQTNESNPQNDKDLLDIDEDSAFQPPEKPEDKEKEKEIIKELENLNRTLVKGTTWYLVSTRWWKQWKVIIDKQKSFSLI
jgi:hypothetical protein